MNICNYTYKYELHAHTSPVSKCADISPRGVVDRYAFLGYSGIVITNHFNAAVLRNLDKDAFMEFYLRDFYAAKEQGDKKGLDVIFGLEIRFPENASDYLVYGITPDDAYEAYDYIFTDYAAFYKGFKSNKNLIIQAHPYRPSCSIQPAALLDGVEVFNVHPHHNSQISLAARFAYENPRLIITGGTDYHHEGHQGLFAMCTQKRVSDSIELADLLLSRDYIFDVCGNKILPYNCY